MARYKHIDTSPRFLAVDLQGQLLPGTIEHALPHLLNREIDLSGFDARFCNDTNGAAAYPLAMLLKLILFTRSSSKRRRTARAANRNCSSRSSRR